MVTTINFGTSNSGTEDSILDSGQAYNQTRGFGWVSEATFLNGASEPIDISTNARDRNSESNFNSDSLIHLQYPTNLVSPEARASNTTPSAWEYDIANGFYAVTVGVGDSDFTDSNHVIKVEGESVIADFAPTADNLFAENTVTVEVTDGRLSLDAVGGENTKLNFVQITPVDGDGTNISDNTDTDGNGDSMPETMGDVDNDGGDLPVDDGFEAVRFNFGPVTASAAEGSIQDSGEAFSDSRGFGWVTQDTVGSENPTPINVTANTRDRNSIQQDDLDSLIHLQYPDALGNSNAETTPVAWEYTLANGQYNVTVSVGDPDFTDSNHVINIEGNNIISGFMPTEDQLFTTTTAVVDVTDGRLSIDAIGGSNTKLNFVEIAPADGSEITNNPVEVMPIETPTNVGIPTEGGGVVETVTPIDGGINVNFGAPDTASASGFIQDFGQAYSADRGFGWVTQASAGSENLIPINALANGRDRNTFFNDGQGEVFLEPVRDSLIHLQYPVGLGNSDVSVTTPIAWEYTLENGQYEVTVGVGDPDFFDSNHVINVEGQSIISGFTPTGQEVNGFLPLGAEAFSTGTATVEVNDGRLTVDAIGGDNTKINYISIVPVN